ncbi:uncharacterized protein RHO17_001528 [Thomomys bottae]
MVGREREENEGPGEAQEEQQQQQPLQKGPLPAHGGDVGLASAGWETGSLASSPRLTARARLCPWGLTLTWLTDLKAGAGTVPCHAWGQPRAGPRPLLCEGPWQMDSQIHCWRRNLLRLGAVAHTCNPSCSRASLDLTLCHHPVPSPRLTSEKLVQSQPRLCTGGTQQRTKQNEHPGPQS